MKEEIGKAVGDRSTEIAGKTEQVKGKVKQGIGDLKLDVAEENEREKDRSETRG